MRRALLASLTLIALGWMAGCGGGSILSSGTVTTTSPAALNGQYAFVLSGFDSTGNSMAMAGSLKADGKGNITGGAVDVNDNDQVGSSGATPLAGTYTLDSNERGVITLTNTVIIGGKATSPLAFAFALQTSGAFGDIMDLSANNFVAAGTMQLQNSGVFSFSGLAGSWIVTLNGRTSTASPTSALGRFTLSAGGVASNIAFDRSIAGVNTAGPTTGPSVSLVFATAPDTNGRGTFTVGISDSLGPPSQTFAYYAITAGNGTTPGRIIAVENDPNGTMTADASSQSALSATTVNTLGAGAVFSMAGIDAAIPQEISAVGQLQITNQNAATLLWDSNDNGGIVTEPTLGPETVTFDSTTNIGRGTITIANGSTNGLANTLVFYLTSPGNGFILDATSGTTNRAMAGPLTAQTGTSFSTATDLAGLALVRSRATSVNDAFALTGLFGPSTSPTYALLFDDRFPNGTVQTQTNVTVSGINILTLSASTGRGTLTLPSGNSVETEAFYVIGPNQFVFTDISPIASGENGPSSVFFANPQ